MSHPHAEALDSALGRLTRAVELEAEAHVDATTEAALEAHFRGLLAALRDWNASVIRANEAPGGVWDMLAALCEQVGLREPPVLVGSLVDRLAILTVQRAREWTLGIDYPLSVRVMEYRIGARPCTHLYVEEERVAALAGHPSGQAEEISLLSDQVQGVFEAATCSPEASRVSKARSELLDAKHRFLTALPEPGAGPYHQARGCPVCGARPRAGRPDAPATVE